jgi:hypothetical protein
MKKTTHNAVLIGIIVVLVAVLCALGYSFWREYQHLSHMQALSDARLKFSSLIQGHPVGTADIAYIAPWMTFDYINNIFKLPPDYLKKKLALNDTRYPRLSIAHLGRDNQIDPLTLTMSVKAAITQFVAGSAGVSTSTQSASSSSSSL